jgi:predicted N-acetyltransferase YhbS
MFIALQQATLLGFACYDATARGFFGPIGVLPATRLRKVGANLLHACLTDMRSVGYGYAIIGGAGPIGFFSRAVGAVEIPGSSPGLYRGMLKADSVPDRSASSG